MLPSSLSTLLAFALSGVAALGDEFEGRGTGTRSLWVCMSSLRLTTTALSDGKGRVKY